MKTHPDSIFVKLSEIADLGIDGSGHLWCTNEDAGNRSNVTEFVPAAAYIELQTRLEKTEYSANGFESLYDAAHEENESLKTQLEEIQKERDELLERVMEYDAEQLARVCPGCYSVAPDPCSPGCIDAKMEREREDEQMNGNPRDEDEDDEGDMPW